MFRNKLGGDEGMFFKFKYPQNLKFWGLNTYIPLAIAFVDSNKIIKKIDYISPFSTKSVTSDVDCTAAIEANYDFFQKNKIDVGDNIDLIQDKEDIYVKFV